jgi:hypothetical protein
MSSLINGLYSCKNMVFRKTQKTMEKQEAIRKSYYLTLLCKQHYRGKMTTYIWLFFNSFLLSAQVITERDRLLNLLSRQNEDSNKVYLLYSIGDTYQSSSPDSAKKYFMTGGTLSKKVNFTKGIQKFYRNMVYACIIQSNYDSVLYYNKFRP